MQEVDISSIPKGHKGTSPATGRNQGMQLTPDSAKRRRLVLHREGETLLRPGQPTTWFPGVDEFDDCDNLFPALAPVPGVPRFRAPILASHNAQDGEAADLKQALDSPRAGEQAHEGRPASGGGTARQVTWG